MTTQRRPFRYVLPVNDAVHELPAGKILHLSEDRRKGLSGSRRIEVWVEVTIDGDDFMKDPIVGTQQVKIIGTGAWIPPGAAHIATCLDGMFVWHLYQIKEQQGADNAQGPGQ